MKLNPQNLQKFIDKPDPSRAAILFYGADTMRVALKRQEYLENLLGPNAEQEMRLTRLTGDEVLKNMGCFQQRSDTRACKSKSVHLASSFGCPRFYANRNS